ncbi:MAG: hypothetical protein ABIR08_01140 [Sphingomonas sp.]
MPARFYLPLAAAVLSTSSANATTGQVPPEKVSLLCDGSLIGVGGKPGNDIPITEISLTVSDASLFIANSLVFDGSYVASGAEGNIVHFTFLDGEGRPIKSKFASLNRATGSMTVMNVVWAKNDPKKLEKINSWFDGHCKTSRRLF